jgi:hypothetical protein
MGRAQSPSLFTLRRFLHKVRKLGKGEGLIDEFALTYLKSGLAAWGVMYIDGHFLPYYGLYPISKGWHGVRQIPMKGSYNFLAVDERFAPWLFLIRSSSEDLLQKIPELIEKAKRIGVQASPSGTAGQADRGFRSGGLQRRALPPPGRQRPGSGETAGAIHQLG